MEVQVVESGPCRRSLTITIPPAQIRAHVDEAFRSASREAQIKGFRPGKVPRTVLEKRFGPSILAGAKESLIQQSFQQALTEKELRVIGQPDIEGVSGEPLDPEQPLEFQIHLDVRPEFELKDVKGYEVRAENTEVTDEDLAGSLEQLAQQKRSLTKVDEPVEEGDFVKADLSFRHDDVVVHERKNAQLSTNIPIAGTDQESFKAKLVGAEAGSTLQLDIKFPETFDNAGVRGKEGQLEIRLHEVMRVTTPPIDDALAKAFDFESLAELEAGLRERIGDEKVKSDKIRIEQQILDMLIEAHPFGVPPSVVADQKAHLLAQSAQQMKEQGADEAQIEAELARHDEAAGKEAERRVRAYFLTEAIARQEKLFVTESDVDVELRNIAAAHRVPVEAARQHYADNDLLSDLRLGIMERKVRDFLRANARITDK